MEAFMARKRGEKRKDAELSVKDYRHKGAKKIFLRRGWRCRGRSARSPQSNILIILTYSGNGTIPFPLSLEKWLTLLLRPFMI